MSTLNWLKAPLDRDTIRRWTVGANGKAPDGSEYRLELPPDLLPDPGQYRFLVLGDTGDSEGWAPGESPQDAVAAHLAADAAEPVGTGEGQFVLHLGDVVYMTGERRLYERNFRVPYGPFLAPESTVDDLVFRVPFLIVPGNHDYYDFAGWGMALGRIPFLGAGIRAVSQELFAFNVPAGGSEQGRAFMEAFVDVKSEDPESPLLYAPGRRTRVPNRYYQFRAGEVDFFALDSNTLEAPPPSADAADVRASAERRLRVLGSRLAILESRLKRDRATLDRWQEEQREAIARDRDRRVALASRAQDVSRALGGLAEAVEAALPGDAIAAGVLGRLTAARWRWDEAVIELSPLHLSARVFRALGRLERLQDEICQALRELQECLVALPEGPPRTAIQDQQEALRQAIEAWEAERCPEPAPEALCARLHWLSEEVLDGQRELDLERRRARFTPEDHDGDQLRWLAGALERSVAERPDGWRIVYMHHPLYTTIGNHSENADSRGVRQNLVDVLGDRVHLVLTGHAHAFEWIRSSALPHTGIFVTGGGGQVTLRPSVLDPRSRGRHRGKVVALRSAGVEECAIAGAGPAAPDGVSGTLYHLLHVDVAPDQLLVHPVGVRRVPGGYRREEPMPVSHVRDLGLARLPWETRRLEAVEIRRGEAPRPRWG
jgi:hypothetical protein